MSENISKTIECINGEVLPEASHLEEQSRKNDINNESKLAKPKKKKYVLKRKKQKGSLQNGVGSLPIKENDSRANSKSDSITNSIDDIIAVEVTPIHIHVSEIHDNGTEAIDATSTNSIVDIVIDSDSAKIMDKATPAPEENFMAISSSTTEIAVSEESNDITNTECDIIAAEVTPIPEIHITEIDDDGSKPIETMSTNSIVDTALDRDCVTTENKTAPIPEENLACSPSSTTNANVSEDSKDVSDAESNNNVAEVTPAHVDISEVGIDGTKSIETISTNSIVDIALDSDHAIIADKTSLIPEENLACISSTTTNVNVSEDSKDVTDAECEIMTADATPIDIRHSESGKNGTKATEPISTNSIIENVLDGDYDKIPDKTTPFSDEKPVDRCSSTTEVAVSEELNENILAVNKDLENCPENADTSETSGHYVNGVSDAFHENGEVHDEHSIEEQPDNVQRFVHADIQSVGEDQLSTGQGDDRPKKKKKKKFVLKRKVKRKEIPPDIIASTEDSEDSVNEIATNEDYPSK